CSVKAALLDEPRYPRLRTLLRLLALLGRGLRVRVRPLAVAAGDLVRLRVLEAAVRLGVAAVRVSAASIRATLRAVTDDLPRAGVATGRPAAVSTGGAGGLAVRGGVLLSALVAGVGVAGGQLVADGGVVAADRVRHCL